MRERTAIKQLNALQKLGGAKEMRLAAEGWSEEWQTLIAVMLSARTRDETAVRAATRLFKRYRSPAALARASAAGVSALIRPVNFYRNKTKSVLGAAQALQERFGGGVPHDFEQLVIIPGVGRKTANVFLAAVGKDAIGVDTHVSYISQKLGWSAHRAPHKIEKDLTRLFPRAYRRRLNRVCVRFGKTYTSRRRKDELLASISVLA